MISIYDVLLWLRQSEVYGEYFERSWCGKLDSKPEKGLGVYPLRRSSRPYRAYEGLETYDISGVSLLIHYNKNVEESQIAADHLFSWLKTLNPSANMPALGNRTVLHIEPLVSDPVPIGTDDNGIYEFVIEFEIYTEKESDNNE